MSHYTKKDIMRLVEEEDVEFIRLQFTDLFGSLKNAAVTASQLEKVLDNRYVFDGSCVEGFLHDNDMDKMCIRDSQRPFLLSNQESHGFSDKNYTLFHNTPFPRKKRPKAFFL